MKRIHELFHSKAAAEDYREYILRQYPPAGYGTIVRIRPTYDKQAWEVTGSYFCSCD